jgi:cobalamin biosynthesis Mg chelatase CobN
MLALVAAVIAGPAAAIAVAGNGPSAGDNQYTDPLSTSTTTHATAPPPASTTPATAPTPAAAPTTAPTATLASSTTSSTSGSSSKTLPMTGYDGWVGALLGAGLLGTGFAVRRRVGAR